MSAPHVVVAAGTAAVAGLVVAADTVTSDPTLAQGGIVGVLAAVVLYFIKRGDAREDKANTEARTHAQRLELRIHELELALETERQRRHRSTP